MCAAPKPPVHCSASLWCAQPPQGETVGKGHAHRPSTPPTAFYAVAAVPVCCCMSAELTCPQPPTCSSHPCHSGALPVAPAGGAAVDTAILHKHPRRRRALTRLRARACWGGLTVAMRPALLRLPPMPPQGTTVGLGCPSGFGSASSCVSGGCAAMPTKNPAKLHRTPPLTCCCLFLLPMAPQGVATEGSPVGRHR